MRRLVPRKVSAPACARGWRRAGAVLLALALPSGASAANLLERAQVRVAFVNPVTCEVTAAIAVALDRGGDIEQRLQRLEGARVELVGVSGAEQSVAPRTIGRTESLVIRFPSPGSYQYEVRYRVVQPDAWAYRCPIWLPAVASDGRSRNVAIEVSLPEGGTPAAGVFPAFQWDRGTGRAVLGNLPAFVRLPYAVPGQPAPATRDVARLMDLTAIGVLAAGTAFWAVRRRR